MPSKNSRAVEYAQAQELRRDGKEIWRWFLAGLLGLLLVELIIGQRIHQPLQRMAGCLNLALDVGLIGTGFKPFGAEAAIGIL